MKRIIVGLLILFLLPALMAAQGKTAGAAGQKLILEFVDGPDLSVVAADKSARPQQSVKIVASLTPAWSMPTPRRSSPEYPA